MGRFALAISLLALAVAALAASECSPASRRVTVSPRMDQPLGYSDAMWVQGGIPKRAWMAMHAYQLGVTNASDRELRGLEIRVGSAASQPLPAIPAKGSLRVERLANPAQQQWTLIDDGGREYALDDWECDPDWGVGVEVSGLNADGSLIASAFAVSAAEVGGMERALLPN